MKWKAQGQRAWAGLQEEQRGAYAAVVGSVGAMKAGMFGNCPDSQGPIKF